MQSERLYSLNHSIVLLFAHMLVTQDFRKLSQIWGKCLWCECESICPSTAEEGAQTHYICIRWMWDAV